MRAPFYSDAAYTHLDLVGRMGVPTARGLGCQSMNQNVTKTSEPIHCLGSYLCKNLVGHYIWLTEQNLKVHVWDRDLHMLRTGLFTL
jgi:hypothetical protein